MIVYLYRRADLLDDAVMHDGDAIREAHRLGLVMRDVDGRRAGRLQDSLELGTHLQAQQRVQVRQRLVHQQHLRLDGERARDGDPLTLASREFVRIAVEILLDMKQPAALATCAFTRESSALCMRSPNATFS